VYILNNPKIISLYQSKGQDYCTRLEPDQRSVLGIDFETGIRQGWLEKKSASKVTAPHGKRQKLCNPPLANVGFSSWKQRYFVLHKCGLLTYYQTKEECISDPLGVLGKTRPKKVVGIDFGKSSNTRLDPKDIDDGGFFMNYDGGEAEMFRALGAVPLTPKEVASAWVNEGRSHLSSLSPV